MREVRLNLRFRDGAFSAGVEVPEGPIRAVDLLPMLHELNDALIGVAVAEAESQGRRVSCRAGCGACCRQIVPISEIEARYLADLIAAMPNEQRERVTARFSDVVAKLSASGLLEVPSDPGERHRLGMDYFRLGLPCPFLENESCSIHDHRPASCREYLVTSPAANCSAPTGENIQMVELPAKLSLALYRFSDGQGEERTGRGGVLSENAEPDASRARCARIDGEPARWMPLPRLLEWAAEHRDDPQPTARGPELFRGFMTRLTKRGT
jgi:Fe-S-cluster containining protein